MKTTNKNIDLLNPEVPKYSFEYLDNNWEEFQKYPIKTQKTLLYEEIMDQFDLSSEQAYIRAGDIVDEYLAQTEPKNHVLLGKIDQSSEVLEKNLASEEKSLGKIDPTPEILDQNLAPQIGKKSIPEENLAYPGIDIEDLRGKMLNLGISENAIEALIPKNEDSVIKLKKRSKKLKKTVEFEISSKTTGLYKKFKKCSKKGCKCAKGKPHGPYWYLNFKDPVSGDRAELYLGRATN